MKRGDVYWVNFDPATGGEIQKHRPAEIVSNNSANRILNRVQVVPLTTNVRKVYSSEALVHVNGLPQKAMAHQIRTVAKQRLTGRLGTVTPTEMLAIERAIRTRLGLP